VGPLYPSRNGSFLPSAEGLATHHIGNVLQWYRQAGLREDAERVRVLLESRAKAVLSEMKPQRFEFPVDREEIERAIVVLLDVPHPIVALYRLAEWWLPRPEGIKKLLDEGGLIVHRIMPTQIIGHMGLPVGMIGTDDEDQEGHIIMRMRDPMNLNAMVFLSGIEEWKKKFELGGLPETPNIFDCLLIPADRISLYREGLAAFDAHDYVKCIHVLRHSREMTLLCSRNLTQQPAFGGDDIAFPIFGLRTKARRLRWVHSIRAEMGHSCRAPRFMCWFLKLRTACGNCSKSWASPKPRPTNRGRLT
jgi:hypothetical protein